MKLKHLNVIIRISIAIVLMCTIWALASMDVSDEAKPNTTANNSFKSYSIDNDAISLANNFGSVSDDKLIDAKKLNNNYYLLIFSDVGFLESAGYYILSINNQLNISSYLYLGTQKPDVFDIIDNRITLITENKKYIYSDKLEQLSIENFIYNSYSNGIYYNFNNGDVLLNNKIIKTNCNNIVFLQRTEQHLIISDDFGTIIFDNNGNIQLTFEDYIITNVLLNDGYLLAGYIDNTIIITKVTTTLAIDFTLVLDGTLTNISQTDNGYNIEYSHDNVLTKISTCNHGDVLSTQIIENLSAKISDNIYQTYAGNIYVKTYDCFINGNSTPTNSILIDNILFVSSGANNNDFSKNIGGEDIFVFKINTNE